MDSRWSETERCTGSFLYGKKRGCNKDITRYAIPVEV